LGCAEDGWAMAALGSHNKRPRTINRACNMAAPPIDFVQTWQTAGTASLGA